LRKSRRSLRSRRITGTDEGEFAANFELVEMAAFPPYVARYIGVAHALSWVAKKVIGRLEIGNRCASSRRMSSH
jgi:hypothetical protein